MRGRGEEDGRKRENRQDGESEREENREGGRWVWRGGGRGWREREGKMRGRKR